MKTIAEIIETHPFFAEIPPHYTALIAGCASNVAFKAGAWLFKEGRAANGFYLIKEGKVSLQMAAPGKHPLVLQTFGSGEILGWSWLVPPHRWVYDGLALEQTRAFAIDGKCLRDKCEQDHTLGFLLMKRIAVIMEQRLQAVRLQVMDIYAGHSSSGT